MNGGCQKKDALRPGPPPVEFSFRKSQIPLRGMVIGIRNTSERETLDNFIVRVTSPGEKDERSYRVEKPLKPHDSITVGWVELDGWKLKPGDELTITCKQYAGEAKVTVPKP